MSTRWMEIHNNKEMVRMTRAYTMEGWMELYNDKDELTEIKMICDVEEQEEVNSWSGYMPQMGTIDVLDYRFVDEEDVEVDKDVLELLFGKEQVAKAIEKVDLDEV